MISRKPLGSLTKTESEWKHLVMFLNIKICRSNFHPDSGKIDSEELRRVLTECGRMKLTPEEAEEFIGKGRLQRKKCCLNMRGEGGRGKF